MRRFPLLLAILAAVAIALAPVAADARAGGGSSMGSRGSRSFVAPPGTGTAPSAAPLERSMSQPAPPSYAQPGIAAPGYGGRPSFMSGFMGGLLGAGLVGLMFGHGFGGIGSVFWLLIEIALVVMVVRFLIRRFAGPQPFFAGLGASLGTGLGTGLGSGSGTGAGSAGVRRVVGTARPPGLALAPADYQAFDRALQSVQAAWTGHDLAALRELVTPEMLSYFAEQLADQESRGVRNSVTDVRLIKGDLSEAWSEHGRDFATVAMRFSMIDVTRDRSGGVVDGSPNEHVTAAEFWTFVRASSGRWLLSAIQQTR